MQNSEFLEWLENSKELSKRSAQDVLSRSRRAVLITQQDKIDSNTMTILIESEEFKQCSRSIKSQLKRAIILYLEFIK